MMINWLRWRFTDDDLLTFKRLHSGDVDGIILIISFSKYQWKQTRMEEEIKSMEVVFFNKGIFSTVFIIFVTNQGDSK